MATLGQSDPRIAAGPAVGGGVSAINGGALVASLVVKASAGKLFQVRMGNTNAALRFLQIFDLAAVPGDGAVPLIAQFTSTQTTTVIDFGIYGRAFANGIVIVTSSTQATKTIGAADALIDALFA